ncbi:hypothetical protein EXIGLDRAFT_833058 [Exidia glandulosa HHB12029]|uniref:F-box domain-containing protein n=1 Tax=Exidia glandulosa HHB12029 TaxID=1314781 RepID=A0A165L1J7_EXIGL|nr:hypothetical protein EXIGLDRAFT_833058 [Exidia glandulosa HHB12029]
MDPASRLPPELVTIVLNYLGQPDVLRAARISPRWRAIAISHPSFYAHLVFDDYADLVSDDYASSAHFEAFCLDVAYVVERNVRISLHVALDSVTTIRPYTKTWLDGAVQVARSLLQACPFIVRLRLVTPCLEHLQDALDELLVHPYERIHNTLDDLLQQPLPLLEFIDLTLVRDGNHDARPLPSSFLGGRAPKLRRLVLSGYSLAPSTPGVEYSFPRLRTFALDNARCALLNVAERFPALVELSCSSTEFIPADSVGFHKLFPRLKHLDVQPLPGSPLPWTNAEQTAQIASVSYQLRVPLRPHTEFEEPPLQLVRCIQAPARLKILKVAGLRPKMHIRIKGGGFTRTFVHELTKKYEHNWPPLKGLVASLGERITHICINWQCLRYYASSTWPPGPVRRIEVDLTDIRRSDDHLFNYDMHSRHTTTADAELDEFDLHVASLRVPLPQSPYGTSLVELALSSRRGSSIWFPAHKVLELMRLLELHLVRRMTLVVTHGVVIEPEDVELLLVVFVDVQSSCTCTACINKQSST